MGVILDFAKMRLKDVENELDAFLEKPLKYVLDKQTLRKALLLEWLDNVRPIIGTRYEHWFKKKLRKAKELLGLYPSLNSLIRHFSTTLLNC